MILEHEVTEEQIAVDLNDKSFYRFRRAAIGLDRFRVANHLVTFFLTFTVNSDNLDAINTDLNRLCSFLRSRFSRANLPFLYLWVVELQKKRFERYHEAALHWHFAIVAPIGSLPHVRKSGNGRGVELEDEGCVISFADLTKFWGKGHVWSVVARGDVSGYLGKYLNKDYGALPDYNPAWVGLRRFGSSQLGYWSFPVWAYVLARKCEELNEAVAGSMDYLTLRFQRVGGWLRVKFRTDGGWLLLERFRTPWRVVLG